MAKKRPQIYNELDIIEHIDSIIEGTEDIVSELLGKRLIEITKAMSFLYTKFVKNDETSYTDLNKYNRLSKELDRFNEQLHEDYKIIANIINQSRQRIYVEQTLMQHYLFQVYQADEYGFTIPNESNIAAALANPIEHLRLDNVLTEQRNQIIRAIQIDVAQGLLNGGGYYKMAERIEKSVGFAKHRAVTVARTEGARARSIADQAVTEEMQQHADIERVWLSTLDTRTRHAHRKLDGQKADDEGYFHHSGMKAKAPMMWNVARMDINCRCVTMKLVNGQLPAVRRGRDYRDADYQQKLADTIDNYMADGDTMAQAYKKAFKRVQPPNVVVDYMTYEEWEEKYM